MTASDEYWGGTDMVFQCLIDKKRILYFKKCIKDLVKENDVVVDLGSGTGILAFLAAEAGAKKIYAVELNNNLCKLLERNIQNSSYKEKIILIRGDASKIELPEKIDVVLCEMIATGLIDELQIPVMNNILHYCKKNTKIIPSSIDNFIDLVNVDENFYGQKLRVIQYEYDWFRERKASSFTKKYMYRHISFDKKNKKTQINENFTLTVKKSGIINGLRITNKTEMPNGVHFAATSAYCMPMIFPLNALKVAKGDNILIKIKYKMCAGLKDFNFSIKYLGNS